MFDVHGCEMLFNRASHETRGIYWSYDTHADNRT